ncbi:uncharacterized protein LOC6529977 [Drosophila yakuba]|uniref:Transmembrane protein n=2 Tax=Drosophila yakuba TaxID=7245 RepID=B4P4J6_DROYA|nr:uncharacterized protein LOC6529977 [Drosophila yakuba]EDW90635.2 uncharacterized protein Dyak_GE12531 [Drosophila yakuba]
MRSMQRSLLLLAMSAILFCAAVALPTKLSKSEEDWLEQMLTESEDGGELLDLDDSTGNHISKRSTEDSSSSSEEHKGQKKDKANSSSEEQTTKPADEETNTEQEARKRRSTEDSMKLAFCQALEDLDIKHTDLHDTFVDFCKLGESRRRRQATESHSSQLGDRMSSDEPTLDAQAEKELDEEMAQAAAELLKGKDNTSIEDYAQGCEVMEVSSKEANEATYAE